MGFSDNNASFKATFGEVYTVPGSGGGSSPVTSVNGKIGDVNLTAADVGAYTKEQTEEKLEKKADVAAVPKKLSDLEDDSGYKPIEHATDADNALYANSAATANLATQAMNDAYGNDIIGTYATKAELLQAIGEALEGEY